jgi:toxin ParE1/3/4
LTELYSWIAKNAGEAVADRYLGRLQAYCLGLTTFPLRGRVRDDLRPGVRVTSFQRQITIVYTVAGDSVVILRILGRGRQLDKALSD